MSDMLSIGVDPAYGADLTAACLYVTPEFFSALFRGQRAVMFKADSRVDMVDWRKAKRLLRKQVAIMPIVVVAS